MRSPDTAIQQIHSNGESESKVCFTRVPVDVSHCCSRRIRAHAVRVVGNWLLFQVLLIINRLLLLKKRG